MTLQDLRAGGLEVRLDAAVTLAEAAEITAFVEQAPSGCHLQRPDWPRLCPPPARHGYRLLRCRRDGRLIATALVRGTRRAPAPPC